MSVPTYNWHCLRCGECCKHIVNKTVFGKAGVFLMPEETKLFPQPIVKPLYGIGIKGNTRPRPKVIYAYQMIGTPCPHYIESEHECRIYEYRPIACRTFPIDITPISGVIHRECTAIREQIPENVTLQLWQIKGIDNEIQANRKLATYYSLLFLFNIHKVDLRYTWFYNFEKQNWELKSDEELFKALEDMRKQLEKRRK